MTIKKVIRLLFLLFLNQQAIAKIAYISLMEPDFPYPVENNIIAFDLESRQILKKIYVGYETGPIFLDSTEKKLYAAAIIEKKIALIDTETLTITHQWENLPTTPELIFLSKDNSKLYFMRLNVGAGINSLYQIDLNNDQVSSVLTFPDQSIRVPAYSENLEYFALVLDDNDNNNLYKMMTYNSNDLSLKSELNNTVS